MIQLAEAERKTYPKFIQRLKDIQPTLVEIFVSECSKDGTFKPGDKIHSSHIQIIATKGTEEEVYETIPDDGELVPEEQDLFYRHSDKMKLRTQATVLLAGETIEDIAPGVEIKINGQQKPARRDKPLLESLLRNSVISPLRLI